MFGRDEKKAKRASIETQERPPSYAPPAYDAAPSHDAAPEVMTGEGSYWRRGGSSSNSSNNKKAGSSSFFSKVKSALKSPAAEREKQVLAQRPPRRDSDEWSYMTDPEDPDKRVKKRKKKMVTYNPAHTTTTMVGAICLG